MREPECIVNKLNYYISRNTRILEPVNTLIKIRDNNLNRRRVSVPLTFWGLLRWNFVGHGDQGAEEMFQCSSSHLIAQHGRQCPGRAASRLRAVWAHWPPDPLLLLRKPASARFQESSAPHSSSGFLPEEWRHFHKPGPNSQDVSNRQNNPIKLSKMSVF